ncbi:MAG: formate dehydrogenase, partial [Proteobacteria bacterium]|nr:formate dehydrogenase [Pseudomonadota bacterium]
AMFGKAATKKNDFGYDWMPKVDDGVPYSWLDLFDEMYQGKFKGFFAWGQNPACSGANAGKNRAGMAKLDWMVNVNLFANETGSFWKGPGMDPKKIKTEVFMLPCAASMEKEGSITNSGRWSQWRYKGSNPPGQAKPDGDIMVELWKRIVRRYKKSGKFPQPIVNYRTDWTKRGHYDAHGIAKLINGYFEKDTVVKGKKFKKGALVPSFAFLKADGSTSSGNWLYCNSYTGKGNMAARRSKKDRSGIGLFSEWAWCWPVNRRIIYNRASVDLKGQPWDKKHPVIRFAGKAAGGKYVSKKWVGDVPDGGWYPMRNPDGSARKDTKYPFIMKPAGHAHVFGPGRADGPFPEHYEPLECPVKKNSFSSQLINPTVKTFATDRDVLRSCDPEYPFVATTYRITEHWQTGIMTRWQPWLLEAEPQQFCEMSHQLAKLRGIKNGQKVIVRSPRGQVEAVAMVTNRFRPFMIEGQEIHQIGLPWCYGWRYPKDGGDSSNLLTPSVGDPNTKIPETKAFMANVVRKGG